AAETHAAQIDDRLADHRTLRRGDPVRSAGESLGIGDEQLVVDAPLSGMPLVAVRVLGRNAHVARTVDTLEVLQAPRVGFAERHGGGAGLPRSLEAAGNPAGRAPVDAVRGRPPREPG